MKYLVMETHPAYAVVLDERGRFLKTANLHYQVGQTVQDVVELRLPPARRPVWLRAAVAAAALAACLCLGFFGYYRPNFTPYGTLRLQINPDVEMTLSRSGRVLDLKGLNADGAALVSGFAYQGMDREDAASELVARAIVMGYLTDGGTVSVSVASEDADWQAHEAEEIWEELDEHYGSTIRIRMGEAAPDDVPQQAAQSTPANFALFFPDICLLHALARLPYGLQGFHLVGSLGLDVLTHGRHRTRPPRVWWSSERRAWYPWGTGSQRAPKRCHSGAGRSQRPRW